MGAESFFGPGIGIGFGAGCGFGIGWGFGGTPINFAGMGVGGGMGVGFGFGYGFGAAKGAKLLTNTMPGFSDAHDKKPNPMQQLQQSLQRMLPKQTAGSSKR